MEILGTGVDIVENLRIKKSLQKKQFISRIFSSNEILLSKKFKNKTNYYSKRFAAKEAFAKAFGTGLRGSVNFKSIEVTHDSLGKPLIKYHNKLQVLVEKKYIHHCHLSISDEKNIAVAFVILEF